MVYLVNPEDGMKSFKNTPTIYTDEHFKHYSKNTFNPPMSKEALWFREIFNKYYLKEKTTPYYWLPKWSGDVTEPSARALKEYIKVHKYT